MQYTDEQADMVKKTLARKAEKKAQDELARREEALLKAKEVALLLKRKYLAEEVYLFGSLAWRKRFSVHSDIDLYIKGFPESKSYWEAHAEADRLAVPFSVTLVLEESARSALRDKVNNEGVQL